MPSKRGRPNKAPEVISLLDDTDSEDAQPPPTSRKRQKTSTSSKSVQPVQNVPPPPKVTRSTKSNGKQGSVVAANPAPIAQKTDSWKQLPAHVPAEKQFTVLENVRYELPDMTDGGKSSISVPVPFNEMTFVDSFIPLIVFTNRKPEERLKRLVVHGKSPHKSISILRELYKRYLQLYYSHIPEVQLEEKLAAVQSICVSPSEAKAVYKALKIARKACARLKTVEDSISNNPGNDELDEKSREQHAATQQAGEVKTAGRERGAEAVKKALSTVTKKPVPATPREALPVTAQSSITPEATHSTVTKESLPMAPKVQGSTMHEVQTISNLLEPLRNSAATPQDYFPGMEIPVCRGCATQGHNEGECPSRICLTCGVKGHHFPAACPQLERCDKCLGLGHSEAVCLEKLRAPRDQPIACDTCYSTDHTSKECDRIWRTHTRDTHAKVRNIPIFCYVCASATHYGPECGIRKDKKLRTGGYTWTEANRRKYIDASSTNVALRDRAMNSSATPSFQPPLPAGPPPPPPTAGAMDFWNGMAVSTSFTSSDAPPSRRERRERKMATNKSTELPTRSIIAASHEPPPEIAVQAGYTNQFAPIHNEHNMPAADDDAYYQGVDYFHGDVHGVAHEHVPKNPSTSSTKSDNVRRRGGHRPIRGNSKRARGGGGGGGGGIGPSTTVNVKRGGIRGRGRGGKK